MEFAVMAAAFIAASVFFLVLTIGSRSGSQRATVRRRLQAFAGQEGQSAIDRKKTKKQARPRSREGETPAFLENLARGLALAGIPMRTNEFLIFTVALAVVLGGVLDIALKPLAGLVGLVVGGSVMPVWLSMKKKKRMKLFENQLSDALTVISNALRAGFSFQQALESVVSGMADPIAKEFGAVVREAKLGLPIEKALQNLADRLQQDDLSLLVSAVLIQKQVGGNLSEILDSIGGTIRERLKIRGQIKTLTAQGKISGIIIGLLPLAIMAMLMVLNPDYIKQFFTTQTGMAMIGLAVVMESVGFLLVRKVVSIKF